MLWVRVFPLFEGDALMEESDAALDRWREWKRARQQATMTGRPGPRVQRLRARGYSARSARPENRPVQVLWREQGLFL